MPGCSTHTAAVCQPRGLLQCPGKWESAWSARGTWAAAGREQWSIRGCCRTAVWFRTESASHLHNRKWLDPPHPLQNTERGLRVGESPVLLVSKLPPAETQEREVVSTPGPVLKRAALGADSHSLESLEDTGSSERQGSVLTTLTTLSWVGMLGT